MEYKIKRKIGYTPKDKTLFFLIRLTIDTLDIESMADAVKNEIKRTANAINLNDTTRIKNYCIFAGNGVLKWAIVIDNYDGELLPFTLTWDYSWSASKAIKYTSF